LLETSLQGFNAWLVETREKVAASASYSHTMKRLFRGMHIPFLFHTLSSDATVTATRHVVRVVPGVTQIFKTKCRVPYKCVLEFVDVNEVLEEGRTDAESTADASILNRPRDLFECVEALGE
jgi:hypothetical protein